MSTVAEPIPASSIARQTIADLLHRLGDIPAERVRSDPPPGTVTFEQFVAINERLSPTCEWIDYTMVEKPVGQRESWVTFIIIWMLGDYMEQHNPGMFLGPDGVLKILPNIGRAPDVSFLSWASLPGGKPPPRSDRVPALVPDLAIEVLSESNTKKEMERKRGEYFRAGVKLVWEIDPDTRSAKAYTDADRFTAVPVDGSLDGVELLPGFTLSLKELFDRAENMR